MLKTNEILEFSFKKKIVFIYIYIKENNYMT